MSRISRAHLEIAPPEARSISFISAGMVEVFDVAQPPPAVTYGWAAESDQGPQYVTAKGVPPANSPLAAVRVWLVSQAKK